MEILAFSDQVVDLIYSTRVRDHFGHVDMVIGCGDLPYYYIEYVVSCLNVPTFHVRGNHSSVTEYREFGVQTGPLGAVDLHSKVVRQNGVILAGIEGSLRYRPGPFQYSQYEMWLHVIRLMPALLWNRSRYGRYLDIFVTHAPPWMIHDKLDRPHHGIKAFRWLDRVLQPTYHLHGHIHLYRQDAIRVTRFHNTLVVNAFGHKEILFPPGPD